MLAIFLDQETSGLDATKHHVLEIAFKIFDLSDWTLKSEYQAVIKQPQEVWDKRDPSSVEINGFSWEKVLEGRDLETIKNEIIALFTNLGIERGKAIFICQNPAFDRGFFAQLIEVYTQERYHWPYHWLDLASMYWTVRWQESQRLGESFPKEIILSKDEIAKYYHLRPEVHPHRAMNGVNHLIECYRAVIHENLITNG